MSARKVLRFPVDLPVGSAKLTLKLAHAILDHITGTGLAAGTRLPSAKALAARFGVSLPSVREALIALETLGHVDLVQGVGTVVRAAQVCAAIPDEDIIALLEARRLLEGPVAAQAAGRAEGAGLRALTLAMQRLAGANALDAGAGIRDFHLELGRLTGNGAIMMSLDMVWPSQAREPHRESPWQRALRHNLPAWSLAHRRIFDAVWQGAPAQAELAMNDFGDMALAGLFAALEKRDVERVEQAVADNRRRFAERRLSA